MGTVNIPVTVVGGNVQNPPVGQANRDNQLIIWTISNPPGSGVTFDTPPFTFSAPPQAGFDSWPGGAVTAGPGPNQWHATVNKVLPVGQGETYKYDIGYTNPQGHQVLDPEIQNEGYPPPPLGEPPKGGVGHPTGRPGQS